MSNPAVFDPNPYLTSIKGKPYLQVNARILWFRLVHPTGAIVTEAIQFDPYPVMRATVTIDGVIVATAYGSAQPKQGSVYAGREIEKAETAAIGRALATAGYGTQFVDEYEFDDSNHLADSPTQAPKNKPTGNGKAPQAPPPDDDADYLTKPEIQALYAFAKEKGFATKELVHSALGVESMRDYVGTLEQAKARIVEAIPF